MTSIVLLDRDGVLNVDLPDSVRSLGQVRLIPDAAEAVSLLNRKGYRTAVATNQACVGRGWLSRSELDSIHEFMSREIASAGGFIDAWFVCTHLDDEACDCRKPRPGLLLQAQARYGFDPSRTWFVGDAGRDIEAAQAAGCLPALVKTGKGHETASSHPHILTFADLLEFAIKIPVAESAAVS